MPVVTMLNQKGGVSKTTTTHNLGGALAAMGLRILSIDADPQASLTQGFWGPLAAKALDPAETVAAIFRGDEPFPERVIRPSGIDGIDLLPGSRAATTYNIPDPHTLGYETGTRLAAFLADVAGRYDFVLIDCPPNLHLCSWAALAASGWVLVPLQAEDYGAQGIADVQESIMLVRSGPNPGLRLLGYLITMFNPRKTVHKLYESNLRDLYGADVFAVTIPHAADFPEAISLRKTVVQHKPKGAAAKAVRALVDEILGRISAAMQGEAA